MKSQVPIFNIFLSLVYLITSAVLLYVLKMAFKSIGQSRSHQGGIQITSLMMTKAWLKRYTLVCSFLQKDKKYLLKQYLIVSTYAAACFNTNHIVLWPITFILFMLPIAIIIYQVLFRMARDWFERKNAFEGEIAIQNVAIEVVSQAKKSESMSKLSLQFFLLPMICFLGMLLFLLCQVRLVNSISNSGELNIQSLLLILTMDQLLMRPALGLLIFTVLKGLQAYGKVDIQTNLLILQLCGAEVDAQLAKRYKIDKARRTHEITSSPFKRQQQNISADMKPSEQLFIDLEHLQPFDNQEIKMDLRFQKEPQVLNKKKQEGQKIEEEEKDNEPLEKCAYLTTPQKQMFQQEEESEEVSHETIIHTCFEDKQNQNSINCGQQFGGPNQFEEFIYAKTPLQANREGNVKRKGQSMECMGWVAGQKGRRKNKRVLKISGTSPYLQYLPNMLKKVQKFKHMIKQSKAPASKML